VGLAKDGGRYVQILPVLFPTKLDTTVTIEGTKSPVRTVGLWGEKVLIENVTEVVTLRK
jgi:hypothetical protein